MVVVATPVPPRFVKRPPFEFGDWSGVDYPCVGVNGDVCSLGTSRCHLSICEHLEHLECSW